MRLCQFSNYLTKKLTLAVFLKVGKTRQRSDCNRKGNPRHSDLGKNFEFFQISLAIMHAQIIGCSGAIALNLTVCKRHARLKTMEATGCYDKPEYSEAIDHIFSGFTAISNPYAGC